jgi:mono/diheme cytochrome c family protein
MKITKKILTTAVLAALSFGTNAADDSHKMHQLYEENCASCHGSDHGGYLAPALNAETLKSRSPTALRSLIMTGSFDTLMPPFFGKLNDDEIRGLVKHLQATPKQPNPAWTIDDMKKSLKVLKDEKSLPDKPTYSIDSMDNIIGVAARGKYGRGEGSKAVFINSVTHQQIGEVATGTAAHIIEFNPANPRWAYVKTDTAEIFKVDL